MKKYLFIPLAWMLIFGGALPNAAQMSPPEQETAKKEIGEVVGAIFQSLEKMDAEALFRSYSDAYGFILVTTAGFIADYQGAKFGNTEWFKSLSSLKVTPLRQEFRFLPGGIALCAWQGKFELTLKTGVPLLIDTFGITFVFSKVDGRWQAVYQHSSSLPPVPQKP